MSQQFDYSFRPFKLGANLDAYVRVKLDGSTPDQIVAAGAGEDCIGILQQAGSTGQTRNVKLLEGGEGTFKVTASGGFAAGAALYPTADGRVDDAGSGTPQFTALQAASGAGSIVECLKRIASTPSAVGAGSAVADAAAQTQTALTLTSMTGVANTAPAAETNTDNLTITGLTATADGTMANITFNSTWSQDQADSSNKNFKEIATELTKQRALNIVLINNCKSFATELNAAKTDVAALRTTLNDVLASLRAGGAIGT